MDSPPSPQSPHDEKLALLREAISHLMATILIVGFLGLTYITVLGYVSLEEPVTVGFLGIVLGAVGAKIEPIILRYFGGGDSSG